jgi:tRNA(His) 5'-end guanylyltransferase
LSLLLGSVCTFETRLYQLQDVDLAIDYFRWRQEEARARAVHRYCAFALAQSGTEVQAAERILAGLGTDDRIELLRQNGVDFHGVPAWQQRGAAVALRPVEGGEETNGDSRSRLIVDLNLPLSSVAEDGFGDYLRPILSAP